jgi:hypothetical protein
MALDRTLFSVDVAETSRERSYWATRPWVTQPVANAIRAADVLIAPWEGRASDSPVFPQGTDDFIRGLTNELPNSAIAVGVDDDQYAELALHGNECRLPTLFVTLVLFPVVAQILGSRIEKWLFEHQEPATIEMEVIVEGHRGKCISIKYKGPPEEFIATLLDRADKCLALTSEKQKKRIKHR